MNERTALTSDLANAVSSHQHHESIETEIQIAAAGRHSYALTTNEVWAWGDNTNGNLGLNSYEEVVKTPQRIALRVSNLASSSSHAFAWNETEVYGWGSNLNFELGLKETKHYPITKLQYFQ